MIYGHFTVVVVYLFAYHTKRYAKPDAKSVSENKGPTSHQQFAIGKGRR